MQINMNQQNRQASLAPARGSAAGVESEICPNCKGVGKVEKTNGWLLFMGKCRTCDGTGRVKEAKPQPNSKGEPPAT